MFFRVRTSLTERPGALALLATRCGEAGLNILGLQIFPDLGRVTDELVISTPDTWTARAVAELVSGAGGDEVSVEPCTTHDLIDQPTRWLTAAHDVMSDPAMLPTMLEKLLGQHPEKWSATEHSRAAALTSLAESVGDRSAQPASAPVEYEETPNGLVARIGGHVVGVAAFALTEGRELTIEVAPAWRRLGIGTQLLTRSASQAAAAGDDEMVLLAPGDDEGFVTMVSNAGLRARIRLSGDLLRATIVVTGVRRSGAATPVPREERTPLGR
ncbi:MAG: N-acetyltransferase [Marmoricola sp.]|jgi:GNAT superfamily N-acetyltransferase|nr:N-acetyltransferase [Marmoricola sp.]